MSVVQIRWLDSANSANESGWIVLTQQMRWLDSVSTVCKQGGWIVSVGQSWWLDSGSGANMVADNVSSANAVMG